MAKREFLRLLRLARTGDITAQLTLARIFLVGSDSTPVNVRAALLWLERAATGHGPGPLAAEAHWMLFGLFHEGVHVDADPFLALTHARAAAAQGHEDAAEWLRTRGRLPPRTPPGVREEPAVYAYC